MKTGHIVMSALVAVLGLAAVIMAQHWLDHRSQSNPAPVGPTAVDLLAQNVEESFQAIENRINQMGEEFEGTQPGFEARRGFCGCRPHCVNRGLAKYAVLCRGQEFRGTEAMPFDPNARVGVIRGTKREEYRIPNQDGDAEAEVAEPDATVEVEADPVAAVPDDGMRAMSISISDIHGVTGFVLPGDHVDIMLTRDSYTDILLQNIKVLAIDHLAD